MYHIRFRLSMILCIFIESIMFFFDILLTPRRSIGRAFRRVSAPVNSSAAKNLGFFSKKVFTNRRKCNIIYYRNKNTGCERKVCRTALRFRESRPARVVQARIGAAAECPREPAGRSLCMSPARLPSVIAAEYGRICALFAEQKIKWNRVTVAFSHSLGRLFIFTWEDN